MKNKLILLLTILTMAFTAKAQLSVASFTPLNDLDASVNEPKTDQNGEKCAIIKVVTTETGFTFDCGQLAVTATVQKTAEIWVYVPRGVRKLKIAHPTLGQLNTDDGFYWFPEGGVKAGTSYRLVLTSDEVVTVVKKKEVETGFFILESEPSGANVYLTIDGKEEWQGVTPFQKNMEYGSYRFRVSKNMYHDDIGSANINQDKVRLTAQLMPAFGNISLTTNPKGVKVNIEGQDKEYTTPCTTDNLASGKDVVYLTKERYAPVRREVTVKDGEILPLNITMEARFAKVSINTLQGADILVDGRRIGSTSYTAELGEGIYNIEATLPHHRKASKQIEVKANQSQTVELNPEPIFGTLIVQSTPFDAKVIVDGKKEGTTPLKIKQILEGEHEVSISKKGYATMTKRVSIADAQTFTLEEKLQASKTEDKIKDEMDNAQTFTVNGVAFKMIKVEGGTFPMGATPEQGNDADADESPTHPVTLNTYYIGETEVTQALWTAVMGSNPSYFQGDSLPVERVSWNEVQEFITKLNQLTGKQFRLPTEAEWEFAARGGKQSHGYKYSGNSFPAAVAIYKEPKTNTVGSKSPNELGLYDMSGNVFEWCSDWYGNYESGIQANPQGPSSGTYRVLRGGCWDSEVKTCRVSYRYNSEPDKRSNSIGFRLVFGCNLVTAINAEVDQRESFEEYVAPEIEEDEEVEQEIFQIVEEMPSFPGGEVKMMEYIAKNIKYPPQALKKGIRGRVIVSFVVEPDGSVSNVKVLRGIGGGCDEEAIRVVKSMPRWKPGKQRGKYVRVSLMLPINFNCR